MSYHRDLFVLDEDELCAIYNAWMASNSTIQQLEEAGVESQCQEVEIVLSQLSKVLDKEKRVLSEKGRDMEKAQTRKESADRDLAEAGYFTKKDCQKKAAEKEADLKEKVQIAQAAQEQLQLTMAKHESLKSKKDELTAAVAQLAEARLADRRTMMMVYGVRPLILDKGEARLARAEELKTVIHNEAHLSAHAASSALQHLMNAKSLLSDSIAYTRTSKYAATQNTGGAQLFRSEHYEIMNNVSEVVNGTLGVQVAKAAMMEVRAASQAWSELPSKSIALYDIALDGGVAMMETLFSSWTIDQKMLSQLKSNLNLLEAELASINVQIERMQAVVQREVEKAASTEAELMAVRLDLMGYRKALLVRAFESIAVTGQPVL